MRVPWRVIYRAVAIKRLSGVWPAWLNWRMLRWAQRYFPGV